MKTLSSRKWSRAVLCAFLVFGLAACGSGSSDKGNAPAVGKRMSVMPPANKLKVDPSLSDFQVSLPEPAANRDWAQSGGTVDHAPGHLSLAKAPAEVWSASVGSGSGKSFKLLSRPIIGSNAVYTMDAIGRVSAFDLSHGERHWRVDTTPSSRDGDAMGGGIALDNNIIYASTGFGEVVALRAADGSTLWRRSVGKPIRGAPTVAEGRVFVITIENETNALDARTGQIMWRHSGISENATLMGASSPAVRGDTVVVAYSSGELFGLRSQNGRVVWSEVLAVPMQKGALPAIADIRGLPVIEKGRVFAISHSGRMISIDERTGERAWEADIGGTNTPCVGGNAVFVVTNDNELVALTRDAGRVIWMTELQKLAKPSDRDSQPVIWSGPVLAGGRLWLTNSLGYLAGYDPETGYAVYDREVAEPFFAPPVVANRTMVLLSDDGRLRGFK